MEGEKVFEMKGERVNDVNQAFEMASSNHVHLIFANALIGVGSYDNAAQQLIKAAYSEREIAQRWDEERKEEREAKEEILSNENAAWISKAILEVTLEMKRSTPRLFINANENSDEHNGKREKVISKLEKILGLEETQVLAGPIPGDGYWGRCYKTRFPKVVFSTFYKKPSVKFVDDSLNKFKEGWYYNFTTWNEWD